jgi:hypothetical protein
VGGLRGYHKLGRRNLVVGGSIALVGLRGLALLVVSVSRVHLHAAEHT